MNDTVKQRLIFFIKSKKLSQAKFEKLVGLSNGFINNISKSIGAEKLQKILCVFPDFNAKWLLTGEGEMLNSEINLSGQSEDLLKKIAELEKFVLVLQNDVKFYQGQTEAHLQTIEALSKLVRMYEDRDKVEEMTKQTQQKAG